MTSRVNNSLTTSTAINIVQQSPLVLYVHAHTHTHTYIYIYIYNEYTTKCLTVVTPMPSFATNYYVDIFVPILRLIPDRVENVAVLQMTLIIYIYIYIMRLQSNKTDKGAVNFIG